MADITDLAKEVIKYYKIMANTTNDAYYDANCKFTELSENLARMVINLYEQPKMAQSIYEENSIKVKEKIAFYARKEQKEKDIEIIKSCLPIYMITEDVLNSIAVIISKINDA